MKRGITIIKQSNHTIVSQITKNISWDIETQSSGRKYINSGYNSHIIKFHHKISTEVLEVVIQCLINLGYESI